MTSPSADRDLLMAWASFRWIPFTSDLAILSDPARSTRWSTGAWVSPPSTSKYLTLSTAWDRLLCSFME